MKTFHTFKSVERFEKFLRSGKYPKCHKSGCLDYVKVGQFVFTMDSYDMDGQQITWGNTRGGGYALQLDTLNRYKYGYEDAKVIGYPAFSLRNDIVYAE